MKTAYSSASLATTSEKSNLLDIEAL